MFLVQLGTQVQYMLIFKTMNKSIVFLSTLSFLLIISHILLVFLYVPISEVVTMPLLGKLNVVLVAFPALLVPISISVTLYYLKLSKTIFYIGILSIIALIISLISSYSGLFGLFQKNPIIDELSRIRDLYLFVVFSYGFCLFLCGKIIFRELKKTKT